MGCSNYPKCTVTYPLPQRGAIVTLEEKCKECGKPMVMVKGVRFRFKMCIDHNCPSKAEWKKKSAEAKEKKK